MRPRRNSKSAIYPRLGRAFPNDSTATICRLDCKNIKNSCTPANRVDEDKDHTLVNEANHTLVNEAIEQHKQNNDVSSVDKVNFRDDSLLAAKDSLKTTPTFDKCLAMVKEKYGENYLQRGLDIASPSGYWRDVDKAQVPIYAASGWEEGTNADAAVKRFLNYTGAGTKLLLGPWEHNYMNISPYNPRWTEQI